MSPAGGPPDCAGVGPRGYRVSVTAAAAEPPSGVPVPPPADPQAIRACLTPRVAAEFDAEWDIVLESAKHAKDLAPIRGLLNKWRLFAYAEMTDPGSYFRVLAIAERTLSTGQAPAGSVTGDAIKARMRERVGR